MYRLSSFQFSVRISYIHYHHEDDDCVATIDPTLKIKLRTMNWSLGMTGDFETQ